MSALRYLAPDGLAARFALLLAVALIVANFVAFGLLSLQRTQQDRAAVLEREAERLVSLVPAIEATGPAARRAIAEDASTRFSAVSVDRRPAARRDPQSPRSIALTQDLATVLGDRPVWAEVRDRLDGDGRGRTETIIISIALAVPDGTPAQWLNTISRGGRGPPGPDRGIILFGLVFSLASVLGVSLTYLRRLTQPLAKLVEAVKAAGRGDRSARVPEDGLREMRAAAIAFNDMQDRIARFDSERMRTLAAVGHDLRTPITSLRIRAEFLDEREALPMIRTLDEMTVMANGLVTYARGSVESEVTQRIDLAELLTRLCEERGAEFEVTAPVMMTGKPVALGRAIGNLVDNAIRYGTTARLRVSLTGDTAIITIEDDGPGIPPEHLANMFEPFVRGDNSRSLETGGAGLGLSIAHAIVTSHGGTVDLENRREGGLCATVQLPRKTKDVTKRGSTE